ADRGQGQSLWGDLLADAGEAGRCRGKSWVKNDQLPVAPSPTSSTETRDVEVKDAGQSKCRVERNQALEQSRRPQESIFIPECNEDGTFAQVQCHTLTGYCWCVTSDGKPVSGSSAHNRTPVCSGNFRESMGTHATGGLSGSVTDRPPGPPHSGRKDDDPRAPEGDEITAPTLWIKQLGYKENKQNSSSAKRQEKVPSCDQERESALDEARQNPREGHFHPGLWPRGIYQAVQCHQSTGYCWCVLVDTGRPIPGTSTRYQTPECDGTARSSRLRH
ncbi:hypothetical protein KUCAC02_035848, partial [Chaenocephalus aceratus]